MTNDYIDVYRDKILRWRYRVKAANHQTISTPGQSFTRKSSAIRSAKRVHPDTPIHVNGVAL